MDDSGQDYEVARLISVILSEPEDCRESRKAVERLVEIGEPAVNPLIQALSPSSDGTEFLIEALGKIRDTRAVDYLVSYLRHDSYEIRDAAATALGQIGDTRIIEPLIKSIRNLPESQLIFTTVNGVYKTLARLGTPAFGPLVACLKDEDDGVRWMSASALGEMRDARAVDPLIDTLTDTDPFIRSAAVTSHCQIGNIRAIDALAVSMSDPDISVRIDAINALGSLVKGELFAPLVAALDDPFIAVRRAAMSALARCGGPASVDLLLARIEDPNPCIRIEALMSLSMVADVSFVSLFETIRERDEGICQNRSVKDAANSAIINIKNWYKARSS
jgi:HEAT repeat protein